MSTPAFHDGTGAHPVDPIVAGQFGQITHEEGRSSEEAEALWLNRVNGLLAYQFPVVGKTKAAVLVWGRSDPVAVVGIISDSSFPGIQVVADDYGEVVFRVHKTECLRQEVTALRYVIAEWQRPILVVRNDASIMTATAGGWDALYSYLNRRPSKKNPVIRLPDTMAAMVKNGVQNSLGKLDMAVSVLSDCDRETVWPLFVVTLSPKAGLDAPSFEERLRTLTQSQRAVYQRMILGLRNKEIAAELGISVHTVVHHGTAVLGKMRCQDRLQLMAAAAAQSVPRKELTAPLLVIDAPTKPDHKVPVAPEQAG